MAGGPVEILVSPSENDKIIPNSNDLRLTGGPFCKSTKSDAFGQVRRYFPGCVAANPGALHPEK